MSATLARRLRRRPACPAATKRRRQPTPAVAAAARDDAADAAAIQPHENENAYAVVGAGLAGLAAAYHLADLAPPGSRVVVYDAGGIGAGGSGAAAGLLHPVSPRGRPLWGADRAMEAAARALAAAETAAEAADDAAGGGGGGTLAWRTGMLKPAADAKQARDYGRAGAREGDEGRRQQGGGGGGGAGCWLGGAPPRALLTAEEARALLPGVAARNWVEEEEEEGIETEDDDEAASLSPEDAARRERQRQRAARRRRQQGQGGGKDASQNQPSPLASALHIPSGITLHPRLYMCALWRACQDLCRAKGGSAELRREPVPSVGALLRQRRWRGVVVAAGAAVGALPEAREAGLAEALELVRGYSLDVVERGGENGEEEEEDGDNHNGRGSPSYPPGAPSLLGKPYLASRGGRALVVGAAAAPDALARPTPEEALRLCCAGRGGEGDDDDEGVGGDKDEDASAAAAAERELLEGAARAWPPFSGGRWRVARVRSGVRAVPPRSPEGALPLVGRLFGVGGAAAAGGEEDEEDVVEVWVVAGLGARGLVYHAWLGQLAARGVVERSEAHVPPELLRWRRRRRGDEE